MGYERTPKPKLTREMYNIELTQQEIYILWMALTDEKLKDSDVINKVRNKLEHLESKKASTVERMYEEHQTFPPPTQEKPLLLTNNIMKDKKKIKKILKLKKKIAKKELKLKFLQDKLTRDTDAIIGLREKLRELENYNKVKEE